MSPLMVQMMLWFYYSPQPWKDWYPAQREAVEYFIREELIEPSGDEKGYRLMRRGTLYVESLLALRPPPVVEARAA